MKRLLTFLFVFFVLFFGLLGATFVHAAETPANALLILAKQDGMLLIVDPASLQVIARVPVGKDPHEVIASSDGKQRTLPTMDSVRTTRLPLWIWWRKRRCRRLTLELCAGRMD